MLERKAGRSLEAALALSAATLLLWFPANLSTLLSMRVLGIYQSSRLASGVISLWREGLLIGIVVGLRA